MTVPLLEVADLAMSFGAVQALDRVTFSVQQGHAHGLTGANGAGKSTLVKILNGVYPAGSYDGELRLRGEPINYDSPSDALRAGIGYVPQEISVIDQLSVAENIFLGRLPQTGRGGLVRSSNTVRRAEALLDELGIKLPAGRPVSRLQASQRQLVMIARALSADPSIVILDEPTASLTLSETTVLFDIVDRLRANHITFIFITHRLQEVRSMCDAVTVLRDGRVAASFDRADYDEGALIEAMLGRRIETLFPAGAQRNETPTTPVLSVKGLSVPDPHRAGRRVVDDVSFDLHRGEVLGIAGLVGSGRTELLNALYGRLPHTGEVEVNGAGVKLTRPWHAKRLGIELITEDRKDEGLLFNMSIRRNISLGSLREISTHGVVDRTRESTIVDRLASTLNIKARSLDDAVITLSGGNQQKVVLARALMSTPRIVLLDEPTKGVDVGTKHELYELIHRLAADGVGVLVVSSDLPELLGLCARFIVLAEGRIVDRFEQADASEYRVIEAATLTALSA